jgi:hypothetical protein
MAVREGRIISLQESSSAQNEQSSRLRSMQHFFILHLVQGSKITSLFLQPKQLILNLEKSAICAHFFIVSARKELSSLIVAIYAGQILQFSPQ